MKKLLALLLLACLAVVSEIKKILFEKHEAASNGIY